MFQRAFQHDGNSRFPRNLGQNFPAIEEVFRLREMGKIGIVHKARNRKAGAFLHGRQHGNDLLHAARTRPVWVDNREQRKAKPVEMRLKPAQRPRDLDSLKLKTIKTTMGAYRNRKIQTE